MAAASTAAAATATALYAAPHDRRQNTATSSGPDAYGAVTDGGGNLIGDGMDMAGLTNGTNGDQVGGGGQTDQPAARAPRQLRRPDTDDGPPPRQPGHRRGQGRDVRAAPPTGAGASKDQRGVARPAGAHCDIGAFEARFTLTVSSGTPQLANLSRPFARPLAVTLGGADAPRTERCAGDVHGPSVGGASATLGTPNRRRLTRVGRPVWRRRPRQHGHVYGDGERTGCDRR